MSPDCEAVAVFASTKAHELATSVARRHQTCHGPQASEAAPEKSTAYALELLEMVLLKELVSQAALFISAFGRHRCAIALSTFGSRQS